MSGYGKSNFFGKGNSSYSLKKLIGEKPFFRAFKKEWRKGRKEGIWRNMKEYEGLNEMNGKFHNGRKKQIEKREKAHFWFDTV